MATKPVITYSFATNGNYTAGPFIGSPTKVIPGDFLNGSIPGQGIPAEWYNYLTNINGQWITDWLQYGTFNPTLDAHIVETDANGESNIATLTLGATAGTNYSLAVDINSGWAGPTSLFNNSAGESAIYAISNNGLIPTILARSPDAVAVIQGEHTGTGGAGVYGTGTGTNNTGVSGEGTGNAPGVSGIGGATGRGVQGIGGATSGDGVVGLTGASGANYGVRGFSNAGGGGAGVRGDTGGINSNGVYGRATGFSGTYGVLAVSDAGSDGALRAYGNGTGANQTTAIIGDGAGELGTGEGYGIVALAKSATPVRSALRLGPQQGDPSSAFDGDVAYNDTTDELRAHIDGQWQSVCSLPNGDTFGYQTGQAGLNNDAVNYTTIATATLSAPKDPKRVGQVLISAVAELGWDTTVGASIDVRIYDTTSSAVVWARSIATPVSVGGGVYDRPWSIQVSYLLPATGPRSFALQFKKQNALDDAVIAIDASIYVRGVF
jgi:hypothetical protein